MKLRSLLSTLFWMSFALLSWQLVENSINHLRMLAGETSLELFFPSPYTIGITFINRGGIILREMSYTLIRAFFGLVLGSALSIVISILFITMPRTRSIVMPITQGINSFPIVGFSPLIILIFGQGSWIGIVCISALIAYFPTLIALDHSINTINSEWVSLMKVWGATKWQIFSKLQFPNALPFFLTSLKLAIPASIIGAVLGEWLGTRNGIGKLITLSFYQLDSGMIYASLFLLVLISMSTTSLIAFIERKLWQ